MGRILRNFLLWLVLFSACAASMVGSAHAREVKPGEVPELSDDEGLVLFGFDFDANYTRLEINHLGKLFSLPAITDLKGGSYARLHVMKAGDYQFTKGHVGFYFWDFSKIPNARFSVLPGKLNYVGELTSKGFWTIRSLSIRNAATEARERFVRMHPELSKRFAWRFAGPVKDPYLESLGPPLKAASSLPEVSNESYVSDRDHAEVYFREATNYAFSLSPSGRFVLESASEGKGVAVHLMDLQSGKKRLLYSGVSLADAMWASDEILIFRVNRSQYSAASTIFKIKSAEEIESIEIDGANVYAVRPQDGKVIATATTFGAGLRVADPTKPISQEALRKAPKIGDGLARVQHWWFDAKGDPLLAELTRENPESSRAFAYFDSPRRKWVRFKVPHEQNVKFQIAGLDSQGQILVFTDQERDQVELVRYDPYEKRLAETVRSIPGVDFDSALYGINETVVGVQFQASGRAGTISLLDARSNQIQAELERVLSGRNVRITPAAQDTSRLVYAHGPKDPGSIHVYNESLRKLQLLTLESPHMEDRVLAETKRFSTRLDGVEIESFLTATSFKPDAKLPLLVLPHGGPFDVADFLRYDPEVQYFAKLGFAVLQVNFRGSDGRGRSFENQAKKGWGTVMLNDVEAAVSDALKRFPLDANRVVALGTSYGGYSAVMLAMKNPTRYRAAVGIAGVYDLPLLFSTGSSTWSKRVVEYRRQAMGDPDTEMDLLVAQSPLHQLAQLKVPVLLLHDRGDEIATHEHAARMFAQAGQLKLPLQLISIKDDTHGLTNLDSAKAQYPRLAKFLRDAIDFVPQ